MPRKTTDAAIETMAARARLKVQHEPHWRALSPGAALGFRKTSTGGQWFARLLVGTRYRKKALGLAEGGLAADGARVLDFRQALAAARAWIETDALRSDEPPAPVPTIADAVANYIAERKRDDGKGGHDAELRLRHHVLGTPLAVLRLPKLREADLSRWRAGLRRGGRRGIAEGTPLAPATVARLLADLRAALNAEARRARLGMDVVVAIREGLRRPRNADRPRAKQIVQDADVRRLIEAAYGQDDDFAALLLVLAATGARLDQVARVTVADVQLTEARIMVPTSRKGGGEKARTHIAVPIAPDVVARLRPLVHGRAGHEVLLQRWQHKQVPGDKGTGLLPRWERAGRRPWRADSTITRKWRAAVEASQLSAELVPYCLRHSSIVRGLRAGLSVRLVAAMHDTSSAMVEKHYSAFVVEAEEDLLRRALTPLAPAEVARIRAVS